MRRAKVGKDEQTNVIRFPVRSERMIDEALKLATPVCDAVVDGTFQSVDELIDAALQVAASIEKQFLPGVSNLDAAALLQRDYRKEMLQCICACRGSVLVTSGNTTFRCKPSVDGGVILYLGKSRKQYHHLSLGEWVRWAAESEFLTRFASLDPFQNHVPVFVSNPLQESAAQRITMEGIYILGSHVPQSQLP